MRFRVTYGRAADLVADAERQFARGGLLVSVPPPDGIERGIPVELEIVSPHGRACVAATVIAPLPGAGVAVGFDTADGPLAAMVSAGRDAPGAGDGGPPHHELVPAPSGRIPTSPGAAFRPPSSPGVRFRPPTAPAAAEPDALGDDLDIDLGELPLDLQLDEPPAIDADTVREQPIDPAATAAGATPAGGSDASTAQKIQRALHGDRSDRLAILRDINKGLHPYVLRNPNIQADEIAWIARQTTVAPDALAYIAGRREWVQKPEVAAALVRNPKTPPPLAIKLLDLVAPSELRLLAKQTNVRDAVQRAARKKLLGPP